MRTTVLAALCVIPVCMLCAGCGRARAHARVTLRTDSSDARAMVQHLLRTPAITNDAIARFNPQENRIALAEPGVLGAQTLELNLYAAEPEVALNALTVITIHLGRELEKHGHTLQRMKPLHLVER